MFVALSAGIYTTMALPGLSHLAQSIHNSGTGRFVALAAVVYTTVALIYVWFLQAPLGDYLTEEAAAHAYDRAAIIEYANGFKATGQLELNFPLSQYEADLEILVAFPWTGILNGVEDEG
jgi:hypothetical protein